MTGRQHCGRFNIVNQGYITILPDGCLVRIQGYVDAHVINMPVVGVLPMGCAATCAASVRVQEMGMEAAVRGDLRLLKLAMLHDSLVSGVCNPQEVWQMIDELLIVQVQRLPQYAAEVSSDRQRLDDFVQRGTRVQLQGTNGAAQREVNPGAESTP